jgi:exonuclease III
MKLVGLNSGELENGRLKILRICTWNVLSLYRPRALKMLIDQLDKYKADTTALQEVSGKGVERWRKENAQSFTAVVITDISLGPVL